MNLHVARTTLRSKPPKQFIELTCYEVLAFVAIALVLVALF